MAEFDLPQQEISNVVEQSDNAFVIIDPTNTSYKAAVTAAGELRVIVTGGGSAGQLVTNGQAAIGGDVGRLIVGYDGTNYQFVSVDSTGKLQVVVSGTVAATQSGTWTVQPGNTANTTAWLFKLDQIGSNNDVDVLTLPNVVLASQASPFTDDIKITLDGELVDVSDRTSREIGKIRLYAEDDTGGSFVAPKALNANFDGVSATQIGLNTVSKLYGYNGATWDRVQVDNTTKRLKVDTGTTSSQEEATFVATSLITAIGLNKSMISIVNTHATLKVKIKQIIIRNQQTTALTGVMADFRLFRITGHSVGTLLTPHVRDTADSLDAAITVRTGSTVAGEAASPMDRWVWSSDEHGVGTLDQEGLDKAFMNCFPMTNIFDPSEKRITLRQNEGLSLKQITNSTNGNFDIIIVFTVV